MKINPNDPYFPVPRTDIGNLPKECLGVSVRTEFIKAAMQGLVSNPVITEGYTDDAIAQQAVTIANKTIALINKETT
jgi:hypothetical protein